MPSPNPDQKPNPVPKTNPVPYSYSFPTSTRTSSGFFLLLADSIFEIFLLALLAESSSLDKMVLNQFGGHQ